MKIEVLFLNIENQQQEEQYIDKKFVTIKKMLQNKQPVTCTVRLGKTSSGRKSDNMFFAEASISTPVKNFGARGEGASIFAAIDELKDELSKKIRRYKDKKVSFMKKGGRMFKELIRKF